ncbi:hypothetical protein [Maridesulfovibrio hydrothermalis]|uniref:Uncharacterized protein n=1 Tax=Maridesulfovibrio hydrothermalis AM13 = DSM 14728 TaxID=1121451 RepID=L0RA89_9BACT|nr:hypothetical protein [Maridesulfovibrio hydrothermalis]CCO22471.1 protein of unknown function [Maridesulfovibrio hydrothermalis AM13 = DSM 14728]
MPLVRQNIADMSGVKPVMSGRQKGEHGIFVMRMFCNFFLSLLSPSFLPQEKYLRSILLVDKVDAAPAFSIPLFTNHAFFKKSLLFKGAARKLYSLNTIVDPVSKVFPLTGIMPFKPGI